MSDAWHELLLNAYQKNQADPGRAHQLACEALDALRADLGRDAGLYAARHMSRLLGNAVHGAIKWRYDKCPRCEIEVLERELGRDWPTVASISRTSRRGNDAAIPICSRCGEREAYPATVANPDNLERHRTDEGVVSPTKWPLSVEQLLEEDRIGYTILRRAKL